MGDRYVPSDDSKKILYIDAKTLYGWAMSESLYLLMKLNLIETLS